jgi:hypothetical protein
MHPFCRSSRHAGLQPDGKDLKKKLDRVSAVVVDELGDVTWWQVQMVAGAVSGFTT